MSIVESGLDPPLVDCDLTPERLITTGDGPHNSVGAISQDPPLLSIVPSSIATEFLTKALRRHQRHPQIDYEGCKQQYLDCH